MLAGALKMLSAANCSLVGGHTSEGSEAALGFSVTGVVHPSQALPKGPLPRGSALILTKPLGTCTQYRLYVPLLSRSECAPFYSLCDV